MTDTRGLLSVRYPDGEVQTIMEMYDADGNPVTDIRHSKRAVIRVKRSAQFALKTTEGGGE